MPPVGLPSYNHDFMVTYSLLAANQVMSLIFDGTFDRHPTLKIVFVEHAFSWILPLIPFGWRPDQLVEYYIGPDANFPTRGLGVIVFLIFTVVIGWIAKGLIGRSVIAQTEALVDRMPPRSAVNTGSASRTGRAGVLSSYCG